MPLSNDDLSSVQRRVLSMFMDTIHSIELIEKNADILFGDKATAIQAAIHEYLEDFIWNTDRSGESHPEVLIYNAQKENFQRAGLYGAQLDIKERHVSQANEALRVSLEQRTRSFFRSPFRKWVDRINNFLGSIASATGISEAIKELKDCLRDELPDDDDKTI